MNRQMPLIEREWSFVHQIMSEEAQRGAIVLLASHVDYDIRSLCSRVFLIEKGRLQMEV